MLFGPKYSPTPTATEPRSSSTTSNTGVVEVSGQEQSARKRGIRYRAFGKRFTLSGSNPARRDPSFQNRTYDAGLGIYDYRNRSFDPATGRFLQRDPVLGGDSLYNPYVFPGNVDPMGLGYIFLLDMSAAASDVLARDVVKTIRDWLAVVDTAILDKRAGRLQELRLNGRRVTSQQLKTAVSQFRHSAVVKMYTERVEVNVDTVTKRTRRRIVREAKGPKEVVREIEGWLARSGGSSAPRPVVVLMTHHLLPGIRLGQKAVKTGVIVQGKE